MPKYVITGKVTRGAGYGRKLGFPTANVPVNGQEIPKPGVYKGKTAIDSKSYRAGIVVEPEKIEAHMIGYTGDVYGRELTVEIGEFLREFKKFDSEEELIAQIKKDLEKC